MEDKVMMECAYCGKEIEYDMKRFENGCTGEPYCDDCASEEEVESCE